ncbi:metallophosphoesterase [Candidatus Methylacidiphilum fumarolicum]|nr:metallophosphoesterase [Candidatus Methylacidiphilum fumarolicum]TFE65672.1 phosphoesterase [Candidatus Methylacidiphilum fumarolicum]TFE74227.1 metallophosphoesterase [Candidatus Methylacidiphilum fumarolicum]TFE75726.1 metallophosphoesterase [Candidatus Methylacidiphilum fumarolicum]TFE75885.1 phosphoesterase [Candidatus Methylacidiphilum fumarolicum]
MFRGFLLLPHHFVLQLVYLTIGAFVVFGYSLGSYLKSHYYPPGVNWIMSISSLWMPAVIYLFIGICLVDISRPWLPAPVRSFFVGREWMVGFGIVGAVSLMLIKGYVNTLNIELKKLELVIKKQSLHPFLRLVVASDIHAGGTIGKRRLSRIINKIQSLEPDLILLPGDLLDGSRTALEKEGIDKVFMSLSAPYGVYGCIGNHECFYGSDSLAAFLEKCGITILKDEIKEVDQFLYIVGRNDRAVEVLEGKEKRKPLKVILQGIDRSKAIFVMDHRPTAIEEAVENQVDLLVCGHTHQGQFWPINLIVKRIFAFSYGYQQIGSTHVIVTRGAGTWGPPVRVGQRSEVVLVEIRFIEK